MQDRHADGSYSAEYWRERADEAHAAAEQMLNPEVREMMERVAAVHEAFANRARRRGVLLFFKPSPRPSVSSREAAGPVARMPRIVVEYRVTQAIDAAGCPLSGRR